MCFNNTLEEVHRSNKFNSMAYVLNFEVIKNNIIAIYMLAWPDVL